MRPFIIASLVVITTTTVSVPLRTGQPQVSVTAGECYTVYAGTGPNPPYVTVCPPIP